MRRSNASYAVTAGLMGALTVGLPQTAYAAVIQMTNDGIPLPSEDFMLGIAAGAGICGVVSVIAMEISNHRAAREEDVIDIPSGKPQWQLAQEQREEAQIVAVPVRDAKKHVRRKADSDAKHAERPQHAAQPTAAQRAAQSAAALRPKPAPAPAAKASAAPAAHHEATDYGDIAQNYVSRITWKERMSARTRGVKQMLAERMGQDMLDDMPIITRADGSVGDVGTSWWDATVGSSMRHDFSSLPSFDDIDMTGEHNRLVPSEFGDTMPREVQPQPASTPSASQPVVPVVSPQHTMAAPQPVVQQPAATRRQPARAASRMNTAALTGADRSSYITSRIAQIDEGMFPVHRKAKDLDSGDLWVQAMEAMDTRGTDPALGQALEEDTGSLAEKDSPTAVLPFRPVAGHPEVVDKETYVDYLLRQEFESNSSAAARNKSRDYLRVLEGGSTANLPALLSQAKRDRKGSDYKPRHMAPSGKTPGDDLPVAQEA